MNKSVKMQKSNDRIYWKNTPIFDFTDPIRRNRINPGRYKKAIKIYFAENSELAQPFCKKIAKFDNENHFLD